MKINNEFTWPLSIRLLHWGVASVVLVNLYILEEGDPPHRYIGYAAVAFIAIRVLLGLRKNDHARILNFPVKSSEIKKSIMGHLKNNPVDYEGHNPLASIVYFLIWLAIILLGVSGFMMGLDAFWGNETLEDIHGMISNILQVLVVIHLIGIAIDAIHFKRKTWMAMITGNKN